MDLPRYKEEIENVQGMFLAPFATKKPERNSRLNEEYPDTNVETRSAFQRDRDRIIHSKAFRRLMYKTQVFVNHEGDHYRTRMTHSVEVSQIARGIARSLAVNEDLVEAIALGHDLGHTPFGHAVEELLAKKLSDEDGFYHNEQSVRVVDILEERHTANGIVSGLNLTKEVREGILKHTSDRTEGIYPSLLPNSPSCIEGQIVAIADTIAYICHDLDDGINAGLINRSDGIIQEQELEALWAQFDIKYDGSVRTIINHLVTDLVETSLGVIIDYNIDSLEKVRGYVEQDGTRNIIRLGRYHKAFKALKTFVVNHIYKNSVTNIMDVKAQASIEKIYDTYTDKPEQLPRQIYKKFIMSSNTNTPNGYDGYATTPARVLCDYIALMTDRYALETYDKLFNPHTKILH